MKEFIRSLLAYQAFSGNSADRDGKASFHICEKLRVSLADSMGCRLSGAVFPGGGALTGADFPWFLELKAANDTEKSSMNNQPILYVEDEENDVVFMRNAWKKAGLLNPLHVVTDGEQAIEYLSGAGKYPNRDEYPLPSPVLLDLKSPELHGLEVVKWIREQPSIHLLPIIVLSSSSKPQDVCTAYERHVNARLAKPAHTGDLVQLIASLKDFWLRRVETPEYAEVQDGFARRSGPS